ncbi:citron Rho-interacting kinase [Opitutia bacterium]|nr:citron Rho-interacting kinase [Opitutae bacterium]
MRNGVYISAKYGQVFISSYKLGTEGAEGAVLQVTAFPHNQSGYIAADYCAKLYGKQAIEGKKREQRLRKIWAMLQNPMKDGPKHAFGWPLSELKQGSVFVGFLMKRAKPGSCSLGEFVVPGAKRLDGAYFDFDTLRGRVNRLALMCNIASGVHRLHSAGHVFVDFKPSNVLAHPTSGEIMFVDLDSMQLSEKLGKFLAPLGTPEYMPPEAYVEPADKPRNPSWDRFSMAVIFYQMITGIHPYCGTAKEFVTGVDTLEDKIKAKMYVGGVEASKFEVIPRPHQRLVSYYPELQPLFRQAFEGGASHRPSAETWGKSFFELMKKAKNSSIVP